MSMNPAPLKPKRKGQFSPILMVAVAGILALSASFAIWRYLNQTQEKVKELVATKPVVIALKEIMAGMKITPADLTVKEFPAQTVPSNYPSSPEFVVGQIAKTTIQPNDVVIPERLIKPGAIAGLASVIPKGQRAITVRVNEATGVGGFILPGDHVDIVSNYEETRTQTGQQPIQFSKTILQNVQVVGVDEKIYDPNLIPEPLTMLATRITLALEPKNSEKLILAVSRGEVRFVLRPHEEESLLEEPGTSSEELFGDLAFAGNAVSSAIPGALSPKNKIDIILGNYRTAVYY